MTRMIDVTLPIREGMLTYPGDPVVEIERAWDMQHGDVANLSVISMSTHTGTHVDPPIHFVEGGATIDRVPLDTLIGDAFVADVRGLQSIGRAELESAGLPVDVQRVLFLTDWSARWAEESRRSPTASRVSRRTERGGWSTAVSAWWERISSRSKAAPTRRSPSIARSSPRAR